MNFKKISKFILFFFVFCIFFVLAEKVNATTLFTEDFETYSLGSLRNQTSDWGFNDSFDGMVHNTDVFSGARALKMTRGNFYRVGTPLADGTITIYMKMPIVDETSVCGHICWLYQLWDSTNSYHSIRLAWNNYIAGHFIIETNNEYYDVDLGNGNIEANVWFPIQIQWQAPDSVRVDINNQGWSEWIEIDTRVYTWDWTTIDILFFHKAGDESVYIYLDDITETPLSTSPYISISSPTAGSTITDASTNLVVHWANMNYAAYPYIWLSFLNTALGQNSETYSYHITAESGDFSVPLSDFGITENGTWTLRAVAEHDANLFLDLTPTYGIVFNISGNSTPYSFTDFPTWYSENSAGSYSAPSDFATAIVGFIQPVFVSIGEFGTNISIYFSTSTAYSKGKELGLIFPTTQAYLDKINVFFGDFPLIQFFEFLIIVMVVVFAIRTIFKFIPFFG